MRSLIVTTLFLLLITAISVTASLAGNYRYFVPYYDMSGDINTGIALTNLSSNTASVTINYY